MAQYDAFGREIPDDQPIEWPLGVRRPETLAEQIRRLVRTSLSDQAAAQGQETFEEANDFEVDEDPDLVTPHEYEVMLAEAGILTVDPDADAIDGKAGASDKPVDHSVDAPVDEKKGSSPATLASARSPISKERPEDAPASAKK